MKQQATWTKNAPNWAQWKATDEDGTEKWFENEPHLRLIDGKRTWASKVGRSIEIIEYEKYKYVFDSLEKRP